jgi:hypothetical protein
MTTAIHAIVVATLATLFSTQAGQIRMSFLNDPASLTDTVAFLNHHGCDHATSTFRTVVNSYYAEDFLLDRSKFPRANNGFYTFESMSNLVHALPHPLCNTKHSWGLNCYDTAILLAGPKLQIGLGPDENYGPFIVSQQVTNENEVFRSAATARDAFSLSYAEWYRSQTESVFPGASKNARTCLVAEIFRWHMLPLSTTSETVQKEVWAALRSEWRRSKMEFPDNCQVVLFHVATVDAHMVGTPHAAILFPHDAGYTYLEKAGGPGPFVRLDFKDKSDLNLWMTMGTTLSETQRTNVSQFITFNDSDIVTLDPK